MFVNQCVPMYGFILFLILLCNYIVLWRFYATWKPRTTSFTNVFYSLRHYEGFNIFEIVQQVLLCPCLSENYSIRRRTLTPKLCTLFRLFIAKLSDLFAFNTRFLSAVGRIRINNSRTVPTQQSDRAKLQIL